MGLQSSGHRAHVVSAPLPVGAWDPHSVIPGLDQALWSLFSLGPHCLASHQGAERPVCLVSKNTVSPGVTNAYLIAVFLSLLQKLSNGLALRLVMRS